MCVAAREVRERVDNNAHEALLAFSVIKIKLRAKRPLRLRNQLSNYDSMRLCVGMPAHGSG